MKSDGRTKELVLSSIFLAFAIILQLVGSNFVHINPLLIGPLISTIILLTTYICGLTYGVLISILIPLTAVSLGALAVPLIPFTPFIIIGNIVFSASFAVFMKRKKTGLYIGIVISSIVKYLVLSFSALKLIYMFDLNISEQSMKMIGTAFTTPQLVISLLGGAVAVIILKLLKRVRLLTEGSC